MDKKAIREDAYAITPTSSGNQRTSAAVVKQTHMERALLACVAVRPCPIKSLAARQQVKVASETEAKEGLMFSSDIDTREITSRIEEFRRRAEAGIEDTECIDAVSSIFGRAYSFPTEMSQYEAGRIFYRARAIEDSDTKIPLRTINNVNDAWEPPADFVKTQGRLNAVGQSILYCCPGDPSLAIDEARARGRRHVAVMSYRSVRAINVSIIGNYTKSSLPKDSLTQLFYNFLDEEFGREVQKGDEGRYSISRAIADTFFNYPEQDAWAYRSVQSSQKFNLAFLPKMSRQCLELSGVMICDLGGSSSDQLKVKMVVDFDEHSGTARYHRIGSNEQKRIFPEIC